jgi:2,3-bisphosphoglycerate-dependent phosphoglycerate mutase
MGLRQALSSPFHASTSEGLIYQGGNSNMSSIDIPVTHCITLLRHGKSTANEERVLQGQMDSPLSPEGNRQCQALARYWKAEDIFFDSITSSPLGRAHETARYISEALSLEINLEDDWMEREFGVAEGLPFDEIIAKYKDLPPRSIYEPAYESGESDWDLYIRAAAAVQNLIRNPPGRYLVVAHGAILNAALYSILGITPKPSGQRSRFRFENTGYAEVEYNDPDQRWTMRSLNNTYHLLLDNHT